MIGFTLDDVARAVAPHWEWGGDYEGDRFDERLKEFGDDDELVRWARAVASSALSVIGSRVEDTRTIDDVLRDA